MYNLTPEEQTELDKFLKEILEKGYIRPSQSPMASPFFFVGKRTQDSDPARIINISMITPSRMHILFPWSMNCWTNLKELTDLQNWMYGGDTIISKSKKVISGKLLSKPIKGFTNQLWCSLECAIPQPPSNQWWMLSFQTWLMTTWWSFIWTISSFLCQTNWSLLKTLRGFWPNWPLPKTVKMQVQSDKGWLPRHGYWGREDLYGFR